MKPIAIIDLGTNTFHLKIYKVDAAEGAEEIYFEKQFVFLGEQGLGRISDEKMKKGIECLKSYREKIDAYECESIFAFGTAALRSASNANEFIQLAQKQSNIEVQIISGKKEASLIYYGVRQLVEIQGGNYLLMDVGGGSVEFLIVDAVDIIWQKSYNIGASVLKKKYYRSDPINWEEQANLKMLFSSILNDLLEEIQKYQPHTLVGSSGTFSSLASMSWYIDFDGEEAVLNYPQPISQKHYQALFKQLLKSNNQERLRIKGLAPERAPLIVPPILLVNWILEKSGIEQIIYSQFAIKEGILWLAINYPEDL